MTEKELKAILESKMLRELGADGPSFDTIVASGHRGAYHMVLQVIKLLKKAT